MDQKTAFLERVRRHNERDRSRDVSTADINDEAFDEILDGAGDAAADAALIGKFLELAAQPFARATDTIAQRFGL